MHLGLVPGAATELLVKWPQGGPDRYNGYSTPMAAGIYIDEPTRIQVVRAWIWRDGPVTASLLSANLKSTLYAETFTSAPPYRAPARWQGVSSLEWDLQPGLYYVSFDSGFFPFGLPTTPIPPGVDRPTDVQLFISGEWTRTDPPFGVEIYGTPLSAVPEPATYGMIGSGVLLRLAALKRRQRQRLQVAS